MKTVLLAFAVLVLAGCAQLTVAVDVLDPSYVRGEALQEGLRSTYRRIVVGKPGDVRARLEQGYQLYRTAGLQVADAYDRLATTLPGAQAVTIKAVAQDLRDSLKTDTGTPVRRLNATGDTLEQAAESIRATSLTPPWDGRGSIPDGLRQQLLAFAATSSKYERDVRTESSEFAKDASKIRQRFAAAPPAAAAFAAPPAAPVVTAATSAALTNLEAKGAAFEAAGIRYLIQGSELSNTEFAYVVANAPEGLWAKNYNRAFGSGTMGNVDVVIKMNTTADFSVKGMRFDATTVASVASKVTTQAVLLGAQMAGVPVSTHVGSTPTNPGDALATSSGDLGTSDQALAKRTALLDAQRSAIRATAKSILGARSLLEDKTFQTKWATDSKLVTDPIAATVDALRPLLNLQDLQ